MPLNRKYGMKKKKYAKRKLATVNSVKRMVNKVQEKKFHDIVIDDSTSTTGTVIALTDIPQGDTDFARDGDQVNIRSWELRCQMIGADNSNVYRVIIFRWNVPSNYVAPLPFNVLALSGLGSTVIPTAQYVFDNKRQKQYTILYDKIYGLAAAGPAIHVKYKKSYLNGLPINYTGGGVEGEGKLYMLLLTDSGAAGHPRLSGTFRTVYTDS